MWAPAGAGTVKDDQGRDPRLPARGHCGRDGHVDGASLIDFYDADFADRIGELDPDASYVVYCRSGNRSGQTVELMRQLGFTDVQDVDGGVLAWAEAGLPLTTP